MDDFCLSYFQQNHMHRIMPDRVKKEKGGYLNFDSDGVGDNSPPPSQQRRS